MTATTRTMTNAQMNWNLKKGFAWWELNRDGTVNDEWYAPIWTKDGCWMWDATEQVYEMVS